MLVVNNRASMFYGANSGLFEFAKQLRLKETEAEKLLWTYLSKNQIEGIRFRRQHSIKYFIADFYCHKVKLVIEVDGGIHLDKEQYKYDRDRDIELREYGLTILHFTNDMVLNNTNTVISMIKQTTRNLLQTSSPL
jgi:very-short-patch-repair endonuclease